jgi:hypothetical protein
MPGVTLPPPEEGLSGIAIIAAPPSGWAAAFIFPDKVKAVARITIAKKLRDPIVIAFPSR